MEEWFLTPEGCGCGNFLRLLGYGCPAAALPAQTPSVRTQRDQSHHSACSSQLTPTTGSTSG